MARRSCRLQPFLDDPSAYPEFSLLVKRQGLQHAFRCGLHRHRTAVLVALAALSATLSGAVAPSFDSTNAARSVDEWAEFLTEGLALDLLARHFEGLGSALACMFPMFLLSAMVYPLHRRLIPPTVSTSKAPTAAAQPRGHPQRPPRKPSPSWLSAAIVASTAVAPVWALAVWGSARFHWGLASGISVGLLSACLSLKSASFAQSWCRARRLDDLKPPPRLRKAPGKVATGAVVEPSPAGDKQDPRRGVLTSGEFMFFLLAAPSLVCEPELLKASARRPRRAARAISEFSHALLAFVALHAACTTFVAPLMRVVASFVFSSPLCLGPSQGGGGGGGGDGATELSSSASLDAVSFSIAPTTGWIDCVGWARAAWADGGGGGSGGWFFALLPGGDVRGFGASFFESRGCCADGIGTTSTAAAAGNVATGTGWPAFLAASVLGMLIATPLVHSLTFYSFWHCVCVGCAELWGYPDRDFYGPWWLLSDEPDAMFRLWSSPVHRWLSSCIYRPIVDSNGKTASASSSAQLGHASREHGGSIGGVVAIGGAAGAGEQAGDRQQQGQEQQQLRARQPGKERRWSWRRLLGLLSTFVFSSAVHEAVTFVAMRRTCWPFNTFTLVLATVIISAWDFVYPVKSLIFDDEDWSKGDQNEESGDGYRTPGGGTMPRSSLPTGAQDESVASITAVGQAYAYKSNVLVGTADHSNVGGKGDRRRVSKSTKAGSKWRGWGAVAFFQVASLVMGFIVDFLAWQWWRHTLLGK